MICGSNDFLDESALNESLVLKLLIRCIQKFLVDPGAAEHLVCARFSGLPVFPIRECYWKQANANGNEVICIWVIFCYL